MGNISEPRKRRTAAEIIHALQSLTPADMADPTTRCMLVRLGLTVRSGDILQMFIDDPEPAVRWLVFRSADELDGLTERRPHHAVIAEAIRWGRAFRAGHAERIPEGFECPVLGPVK